MDKDKLKAIDDCLLHGTGVMKGGKHVPLEEFKDMMTPEQLEAKAQEGEE